MNDSLLVSYGFLIGILISLPLGPIGFVLMQRSSTTGPRAGLISGIAIAGLGSVFAFFLIFGIRQGLELARSIPSWLILVSSFACFTYGFYFFHMHPLYQNNSTMPWKIFFASVIKKALLHPALYFSFGIIGILIARLFATPTYDRPESAAGFFLGTLGWWSMLAWFAFTKRFYYQGSSELHRIIAAAIMVLSAFVFATLFF